MSMSFCYRRHPATMLLRIPLRHVVTYAYLLMMSEISLAATSHYHSAIFAIRGESQVVPVRALYGYKSV